VKIEEALRKAEEGPITWRALVGAALADAVTLVTRYAVITVTVITAARIMGVEI